MRGGIIVAALGACLLSGCVDRLMQIRSDPPGAEVMLDGKVVGRTPVDVKFHWYGDREIILRKPGYKTKKVLEEVGAPWYQIFPLDLITDVLIPFTIRDHREFSYMLEESGEPEDVQKVMERGNELRKRIEPGD